MLAAASLCFAKSRYEDINVREIAEYAGVTPALINRYFGSKALLFTTVLANTERILNPLDGDITQLGKRLAHFLEADFDKAVLIPGGVSLLILLNAIVSEGTRNLTVEYVRTPSYSACCQTSMRERARGTCHDNHRLHDWQQGCSSHAPSKHYH